MKSPDAADAVNDDNDANQIDTDADSPIAAGPQLGFPVVGIGASAGCVDALQRFFTALPEAPGMAFVIVVHLSPEHESNLDAILGRATSMPVHQVRESMPLAANQVYVISPAHQLEMRDGGLHVSGLDRVRGRHMAIDVFFRTLAEAQHERAFGVVLSGTGSDGSVGLRRLKELGGVAIAQAPVDAEYEGMPQSAIDTGTVDFVLPAGRIGARLIELWRNAQRIELPHPAALVAAEAALVEAPDAASDATTDPTPAVVAARRALAGVMALLHERTGHDFKHYKRATVLRRIERRLQVNAVATLPAYHDYLKSHADEPTALLKDLLISVTNFFRDPEAFDALQHELGVALAEPGAARPRLRAWVAGCATGEEAFSVAMVLTELADSRIPRAAVQVFATDIDEHAIGVARAGVYPDSVHTDVASGRLRTYFNREENHVRIRKSLREKVLFAPHNVLRDPPFSSLDLVCCRNLLIYLDREVQQQVLQLFHFALQPGGLLFLGLSESAEAAGDLFEPVDKKHRIYRATTARRSTRPAALAALAAMPSPAPPAAPWRAPVEARTALGTLHDRVTETQPSASVLVDGAYNILHSTVRAHAYLRFAAGQPSQNLLDVVRPELGVALRAALARATQDGTSVDARRVRLGSDPAAAVWVSMNARPVTDFGATMYVVRFDQAQVSFGGEASASEPQDPMLLSLERELQRTRDLLRGSEGESAASNEELRASNEELQAINEELRSTTEELETSKEELQSVNEELLTVNQELKAKVDDTSRINDDLKNLITSSDIATVFVDRHMRINRFTPRASQLFNLIDSDVGRSLLDITHRLHYDALEADAMRAFQSLHSVEREVKGEDGHTYLVRALPYRTHDDVIDGAVLSFIDITSTRRAEAEALSSEARLRVVVDSTDDYAIIATDAQGAVTAWNRGAQRLFGHSAGEVTGQPLDLIYTPEDRAAGVPQDERRRALDEGRASDDRWHLDKAGRPLFCSGITTPIREAGVLVGFAKIAHDRSASKEAEAKLEELLAQESEMRTELQRALTLKDEFLAVMSHELKHPLNLIHVNAELLSRLPQVRGLPAASRAAEVIRRTVMGQAKIIDDLLDLSRVRTGKLALNAAPLDWVQVVNGVLEAVAGDAAARRIEVETEIDANAAVVLADPVRAEQIVWNLVSNALKFTPPGGRVTVRLAVDAEFGRLDVADTGQGIGPDFLPHVFDMFRQADRSTTRPQGGMGIGLAIVKQLTEAHGGRVAVASAGVGQGATFSVWLPLADGRSSAANDPSGVPVLSGLRMLLVDDADDALESFAILLRLEGADVATASSGAAALEVASQRAFDVVMSDVAMPGMDGYTLIAALRKLRQMADVKAIALTGFNRPEDLRRARAAGFDAHLVKPVAIDELLQVIERLRHAPRNP